jgi:FkbM family methyltransferase
MYEVKTGPWRTPNGRPVTLHYRDDTNDWNTLTSALDEDEYGLAGLSLSGAAADIGAHIGAVTVGLLVDHPGLVVHAVEPLMENIDLLQANLNENGVAGRCQVRMGAVGVHHVDYAFVGSGVATHHAFVGNAQMPETTDPTKREHYVNPYTLADFPDVELIKIDCEGGEWGFLDDPLVATVPLIVGEWHNNDGHTLADMASLLGPTHTVTFSGPQAGPGGFRAVRRA